MEQKKQPETLREQVDALLELSGYALASALEKLDIPEAKEASLMINVVIPDAEAKAHQVFTRGNVHGEKMESLILTLADTLTTQFKEPISLADLFTELAASAKAIEAKIDRHGISYDDQQQARD